MCVRIAPPPPTLYMESFKLLDADKKLVKNYPNQGCFAMLRSSYLKEFTKAKYLKIYGGYAHYPVAEKNVEAFKPFVDALMSLLQIKPLFNRKKFTYKIDIEVYPADVVLTFLRCMSIIQEGRTENHCMELFHALTAKGIHPTLAAVACVMVGSPGGNKDIIGLTTTRYPISHGPIYDDNITIKTFRELQEGTWRPKPQQKSLKEQHGYYYGYGSLIGDCQLNLSPSDYYSYGHTIKERMEKAKYHPLEFPVLYLLQFKYGNKCSFNEYVKTVVELANVPKYTGYATMDTDWLYNIHSQLGARNW